MKKSAREARIDRIAKWFASLLPHQVQNLRWHRKRRTKMDMQVKHFDWSRGLPSPILCAFTRDLRSMERARATGEMTWRLQDANGRAADAILYGPRGLRRDIGKSTQEDIYRAIDRTRKIM